MALTSILLYIPSPAYFHRLLDTSTSKFPQRLVWDDQAPIKKFWGTTHMLHGCSVHVA